MNKNLLFKFLVVLGAFMLSSVAIGGLNVVGTPATTATTSQDMPTISFSTGSQTTDTLANMIADFNANFSASYGFKVKLDSQAFETTSQHETYVADFQAQSTAIDVISMDVIWPAEFASSGYILPLNDVFNSSYQSQFLNAPIQAGTVDGNIYGVPWFHDSAMLFYRTDILQNASASGVIQDPNGAPPATWDQLKNWSIQIMNNTDMVNSYNLTAGFVWQGKSYEGLMCDFMEYIGGTGTYTFLNGDQTSAVFNSSQGISDALTYMKSLIDSGASPKDVLTYDEEGSRAVWNAGNSVFMRNWPYAYALSLNSAQLNGSLQTGQAKDVQQFNVTTMPAQDSSVQDPRTSCLGGWQVGVSAFSKYPDQSKKFIMWLTAAKQQTTYFLGGGQTPTLKALYNTPAIENSPQGYVSKYLPVFESALPRPVSPLYPQMSAKIAPLINAYLGGSTNLADTLAQLQTQTDAVINSAAPTSSGYSSPIAIMLIVLGLGTIVTLRKRRNN